DNIFFDISNADFSIVPATTPDFVLNTPDVEGEMVCLPATLAIDFSIDSLLGFGEMVTLSVPNLPAGITATFSADQMLPGNSGTLTLDIPDDPGLHGDLLFHIRAEAAGVAMQERPVSYHLVSNNFSALELLQPADGLTGQSPLVDFSWTNLANANTYTLEVSTDPTFDAGALVVNESGLGDAQFSVGLEGNTAYFWRVKATNECGEGNFGAIHTFHTITQSCKTLNSTDGPFNISSAGLPVIQSQITIAENGQISDVNVPNIKGNHVAVGDLEFRLRSPDDEVVILYKDPTCGTNQFNFGFDDESSLVPPSPCTPNTGLVYKPFEPLAAFIGKDVQGTWTLETAVVNDLGDGGTFESWAFEYCGSFEVNNPFVVNNHALRVPPNDSRAIPADSLMVQDADNGPNELSFTIVTMPQFGTLSLNGSPLGVNGMFTQSDLNNRRVRYENTDGSAAEDGFTFIVRDGNGGFLGTPRFQFIIDPDAPVGTTETEVSNAFRLYPNPARDFILLEWNETINESLDVSVFNVHGQLLSAYRFDPTSQKVQIPTASLPAGVYLITIKMKENTIGKRIIIE
ncbi:MAG: T9SS C-terminal target domain-containing protein, partial [Bacteroidetes bacterium]